MSSAIEAGPGNAWRVRVRGVVQGVGFRPFVHRLAVERSLAGWVRNTDDGVEIVVEGPTTLLDSFVGALQHDAPTAAVVASVAVEPYQTERCTAFEIRASRPGTGRSVRLSPDLAVCDQCLAELRNPADPRHGYPYLNCTGCGPRYSIIEAIPYDRAGTIMRRWPLVGRCATDYHDPGNRRFHAQPVACPDCGPHYLLIHGEERVTGDRAAIRAAGRLLAAGAIVAVKGLGGYHLACDARNPDAVRALRGRKFRKERPFAVMARDLAEAERLVQLDEASRTALTSVARPIVLAPAITRLA